MKNKLGTCTWTLGLKDLRAICEKVKELGLDGFQFSGDGRTSDAKELKAAADVNGLTIFAIDPYNCKPDNDTIVTAEAAIQYYKKEVIDFAAESGAPWVTIQGLAQWTKNCKTDSEAWEQLVFCCRELSNYAKEQEITLVFEAVNRYESPLIRTAADCVKLIKEVGDEGIGVVLDSFHMNIEEHSSCEALRLADTNLASYHISDSNRSGIGSGQINFLAQHRELSEIKFKGPVMIEIVLPALSPATPPRNPKEWHQFNEEIKGSIHKWRAYDLIHH
jgi:D-psicose/D-tagatose/L-ribulose 3-epimerase